LAWESGDLKIFTGNGCVELAHKVAAHLGLHVSEAIVDKWGNGEIRVQLCENVRGADVFLFQSFGRSVNDRIMELLVMLDAARRASAARITCVIPYYPYAKQERKFRGREPISARLVADLFVCAGAHRILTVDLHEGAIQGFFNVPVDHLPAYPVFANELQKRGLAGEDVVIVAPDEGCVQRAVDLSTRLGSDICIVFKRHPEISPESAETIEVVGQLEGKTAMILDDMILSGSTLLNAAEMVLSRGAREVHACVTHPVLCQDAVERIAASPIKELIVSDTIPLPEGKDVSKITVISLSDLIASAIDRIHRNTSVSELLA